MMTNQALELADWLVTDSCVHSRNQARNKQKCPADVWQCMPQLSSDAGCQLQGQSSTLITVIRQQQHNKNKQQILQELLDQRNVHFTGVCHFHVFMTASQIQQ